MQYAPLILKTNIVPTPWLMRIRGIIVLFFMILYCNFSGAQSRLYLANDNHTDYMWSGDEATYDTAFVSMIDAWMANNNATSTKPADYQTKFNCDGTYWAWAYQKKKTPAEFQQFINQVKAEKIILPMNPLIITYGCVPAEAAIRGMYYAGELQRKYDVRFDIAMTMENQVLPLGLPSLWKGSGAKYAWHGVCNCATMVPNLTEPRQQEIYWYKGLDDQSVLMKWYTITTNNQRLGGYAEAREPANAVADLTAKVNTPGYNYNVAGAFGVGWDDLETTTDQLSAAAQQFTNPTRRVIVSNELDFFRDFETTYGATLPSITETYGDEWEHGCASLAAVSSSMKRSLEKLRSAESMATIVARTNPSFANALDSLRRVAWMSLGIYWEHDFGGGPAVSTDERTAWQKRMEQNFTGYVDQLYSLALANLANQIKKTTSTNQQFFVYNPLSWTRTDYADFPYTGTLPIHVVDVTTGAEVRSQIITVNNTQYIRLLAAGVPSVGYKIFEIHSGNGSTVFGDAGTVDVATRTIDNDYYTIVFNNNGAILSLIDKTNGNKQLVRTASDSDYLNNIARNYNFAGNINTNGSFVVENAGPVSVTVKITSARVINHETSITVFNSIPRLEIDNSITQNFDNDFMYTTFSFNSSSISAPTIWHEENGAVIHAKKVSNGGHYADQQARYDWPTLNHFAAVSDNGNYGVTLSNEDCYFMQTGNSTIETLDENTAKIKVLVGGRVDSRGTFSQGDDAVFNQRYAITPYTAYTATNSMKNSLEHQNSLLTGAISNTAGILPENNFSFLTISDPNTLLWALKPSEDGMDTNGAILRVWNLANTPASNTFTFSDDITDAENITHIETDVSAASFSNKTLTTSVGKNQIKSYRIKLAVGSALPINITDFTGTKDNGINKLTWQAITSATFSHFEIERSNDGNSFDSIGSVSGGTGTAYSYNDTSINELNSYYYRLKMVAKDGTFSYSTVILILADPHTQDIMLYPNPVQDVLKFHLLLTRQGRYDIRVNDITGKMVLKLPSPLFEAGDNYFSINTSNLPTGTYTLSVSGAEKKYIRKFIKH
jgi:alpha-mannosidase